jgi:hypothetical protein
MLRIIECFQDKPNPQANDRRLAVMTGPSHACASNMVSWGPRNGWLISISRCRRATVAFVKAWSSARMLSLKATDCDREANRNPVILY